MNCARKGCSKTAVWQPNLGLRTASSDVEAEAAIGIGLCDEHKAEARLEDLVTDKGWEMICGQFGEMGRAIPDRSRTRLIWKVLS